MPAVAKRRRVAELRSLIIVLGDQLDLDAAAFDGFAADRDAVWMAEVAAESTHVWSSKPRITLFLAAMRHFALALRQDGRPLHYTRLDAPGNRGDLAAQLQADIQRLDSELRRSNQSLEQVRMAREESDSALVVSQSEVRRGPDVR